MSLEEKLMELHKLSMSQNRQVFSEDEKRLLQFHLSNLEYACGAPIAKVGNWFGGTLRSLFSIQLLCVCFFKLSVLHS